MDLGLGGRAAIVTGASRGIGRGVAEALVREGAQVLLCGRDTAALEAVAKEIGHDSAPMTVDILVPSAAEAIVARLPRVGVAAGLVALKTPCSSGRDVDCFEATDRVAGHWNTDYDALHLITSRDVTGYATFPMPAESSTAG